MTPTTYGYDTAYCLKSHCGVRGCCRQSGYFCLNLSDNSVMRGRVHARRTLKGLVADLRYLYISARATKTPSTHSGSADRGDGGASQTFSESFPVDWGDFPARPKALFATKRVISDILTARSVDLDTHLFTSRDRPPES